MGRVDNKIVVITGASSGQGAAEAAALAAEGAIVIATDIQEPLEPLPEGVVFRTLDVTSPDDWERTAAWLASEHSVVHGLVNNAGITWRARIDEVRLEDWDRVLRTNLTSAMLGIQAIVPLMTAGGSIVNISSRAALSGHFTSAYTTAKWGLRGLSRVASLEFGGRGIRSNCLLPGYIDTPMVRTAPPAFREASMKEIPLGRGGTPADIAPLVVYLVSDESSYISGAEISIDGGEAAHGGTKVYSDLLRSTEVSN
ncbi:MAG TPA: SDR family NAD(P)-dependent oxidoreductase [Solirubrobacteraceae bacterium]|nr:SDR family NAD(P)-dependent oxidoreductase [Solirubrobacteraceae bacterium]